MAAISRRNLFQVGAGFAVMAAPDGVSAAAPIFRSPQINLYSRDLPRAAAFYRKLGFVQTFRTPEKGPADHIELKLGGFTLGIATFEAARTQHGLHPGGDGRWIEVVLQTDNADKAVRDLVAMGAPLISAPHDFAGGRNRAGWVADPDGNPIQIYQQKM
jgi:catechol 2,3-dioxygenase-like lactoylglutathione lyase family enzyme